MLLPNLSIEKEESFICFFLLSTEQRNKKKGRSAKLSMFALADVGEYVIMYCCNFESKGNKMTNNFNLCCYQLTTNEWLKAHGYLTDLPNQKENYNWGLRLTFFDPPNDLHLEMTWNLWSDVRFWLHVFCLGLVIYLLGWLQSTLCFTCVM